jgi:hypothetical protein
MTSEKAARFAIRLLVVIVLVAVRVAIAHH